MNESQIQRLLPVVDELGPGVSGSASPSDALHFITARGLCLIPGAEMAGITRAREDGYETVAPTSEVVSKVDSIQYELSSGPCVDAAEQGSTFRIDNLPEDPRWPEFGPRASSETGVLSMLSFRMYFEDEEYVAALNLYATRPAAFDDDAVAVGLLVATYGALAVTSARRAARIENLERALTSNRDIGVAVGVLMGLHRVTRDQAFDLLRLASQSRHRKLADIASDVAETGSLDAL